MARIDDLIAQVTEPELQKGLGQELDRLRKQSKFGLLFEHHVPEITVLPELEVRVGESVAYRSKVGAEEICRVLSIDAGPATMTPLDHLDTVEADTNELVVVKEFGTPVYPVLASVGSVEKGGNKPLHASNQRRELPRAATHDLHVRGTG